MPLQPRIFEDFDPPDLRPLIPSIPEAHGQDVNMEEEEEEDSSMPFKTALQRLFITLAEAIAFFNQLEHSFTRDIQSITYAHGTVRDQIWKSKVAAVSDGQVNLDSNIDRRNGMVCDWLQQCKTLFVALFTDKAKTRHGTTRPTTRIPPASFHNYLHRLEKDLIEALHARWPRGFKKGQLEPEWSSDMALGNLIRVYHRMAMLVDRLHQEATPSELCRRHQQFVSVKNEIELLQIELGRYLEFGE